MLKRVPKECSEKTSLMIFIKINVRKALFCYFIVCWPWGFFKMTRVVHDNRSKGMTTSSHLPEPPGSLSHVYRDTHVVIHIKGCMNVI